jgi:hypothetical protein
MRKPTDMNAESAETPEAPDTPEGARRRQALAHLSGAALWPAMGRLPMTALSAAAAGPALLAPLATPTHAVAKVRTDLVTVLYRRESPSAPNRLDDAVRFAVLALEKEFIERGFRVLQPSIELYNLMDKGPTVVVTFAEDAGYSLVFSVYKDIRPVPGKDTGIAEVRLQGRVCVGRHIVTAEEGRGQVAIRTETATREFAERRGLEVAAKRAAADLADLTVERLKALTPEELQRYLGGTPTSTATADVLPLPVQPEPAPRPNPRPQGSDSAPSAPPAMAPSMPAPAPQAPPPLVPSGMSPVAPPGLTPAAPQTPRLVWPLPWFSPKPAPAPQATPGPAPAQPASSPASPSPAQPPTQPARPVSGSLPPPRNRHALLIGISDYSSVRANGVQVSDLKGVANDIQLAKASLTKLGYGDRMKVLFNQEATQAAVSDAMKDMVRTVGPEDQLVIFLAGHGGSKDFSRSGYGMPLLADFRYGAPGAYDFWDMQSQVLNMRGRVVWITDTCHSGGATENVRTVVVSSTGVTAQDVRGPDAAALARDAGRRDVAILTAASASEMSWETNERGLFTTRLFESLQGDGARLPLSTVFQQRVEGFVIQESQGICRSQGNCTQQTPAMAFGGNGQLIQL